jgi:glutamate N-acetyltransferase/amino-acid N-acetyltransferase
MDRVLPGIDAAAQALSPDGWEDFSEAILTTDKGPKRHVVRAKLGRAPIVVAGCAKGAGMIAPDMATTLAFVCTDAAVSGVWLRRALRAEADVTFNSITVDGDTSTNDSLFVLASGAAGNPVIRDDDTREARALRAALHEVLLTLATAIVRDGEGATKVVEIAVEGARTEPAARAVARRIANSPLVKTAIHGADPNWGRFLAAAGAAGVALDQDKLDLDIGEVPVVRRGVGIHGPETEAAAHAVMSRPSYRVTLRLGAGRKTASMYTCDLTHGYIDINADYRS